MNSVEKELDALERELAELKPVTPRLELKEQISEKIQAGRTPSAGWTLVGIAAALLLGLGVYTLMDRPEVETVAAIDWQPMDDAVPSAPQLPNITTQRLLVNQQDEGVMHLEGIGPVRKVRYQTITRSAFTHPESGRQVSVTTPEEKVLFVRLENQL